MVLFNPFHCSTLSFWHSRKHQNGLGRICLGENENTHRKGLDFLTLTDVNGDVGQLCCEYLPAICVLSLQVSCWKSQITAVSASQLTLFSLFLLYLFLQYSHFCIYWIFYLVFKVLSVWVPVFNGCKPLFAAIWLKEGKKKKPSAFDIRAFPPNVCKHNISTKFNINTIFALCYNFLSFFFFFFTKVSKNWPAHWKAHLHL